MNVRRFFPVVVVYLAPLASFAGCGSGGNKGSAGEVGTYEPDGGLFFASGDASTSGPLDAHIEQNHVAVTFVTLSCTGPCADVVAVPTGGHAPYTFKWDDGSTNASRNVCPTSSTSYSVKVTDTGTAGELARAAETVQVPLAASVIACPDGGEAPTDASTALPGDTGCSAPMSLGSPPASCMPPAGVQIDSFATAPLVANVPTSFRVTGTGMFVGGAGWHFEVWGSPDGCTLDEQLGAFQLANGPYQVDICATPARANQSVVFVYRLNPTDGLGLAPFSFARCGGCATRDN
jgi:hypothetical protein